MAQTETVAVLGAGGTMGFPITRNIARAGIGVRAWNRSRQKAEPLAQDGAFIANSPAEAARGAGIVLTMLADEDAVVAAMDGPHGALSAVPAANSEGGGSQTGDPNGPHRILWLQMSTIGEAATRRCAELANRRGVGFVDAPVLGTRKPAEEGKLVILESGPEEARPRIQPIFDAIGQRTIRVGEAGAGSRLKLVTNNWVLAVVEIGAETIAMCEGFDLDPRLFFQAIEGGTLDLPYLRMKGKAMMERDFTPAFQLKLAAKDARLIQDAARSRGLDLPLVDTIVQRMTEGAEARGDEDFSATFLTSEPRQQRAEAAERVQATLTQDTRKQGNRINTDGRELPSCR
jgi:3-hydroxyisobutyrate dehydrogenase